MKLLAATAALLAAASCGPAWFAEAAGLCPSTLFAFDFKPAVFANRSDESQDAVKWRTAHLALRINAGRARKIISAGSRAEVHQLMSAVGKTGRHHVLALDAEHFMTASDAGRTPAAAGQAALGGARELVSSILPYLQRSMADGATSGPVAPDVSPVMFLGGAATVPSELQQEMTAVATATQAPHPLVLSVANAHLLHGLGHLDPTSLTGYAPAPAPLRAALQEEAAAAVERGDASYFAYASPLQAVSSPATNTAPSFAAAAAPPQPLPAACASFYRTYDWALHDQAALIRWPSAGDPNPPAYPLQQYTGRRDDRRRRGAAGVTGRPAGPCPPLLTPLEALRLAVCAYAPPTGATLTPQQEAAIGAAAAANAGAVSTGGGTASTSAPEPTVVFRAPRRIPGLNADVLADELRIYPTIREIMVPPPNLPAALYEEYTAGGAIGVAPLEYRAEGTDPLYLGRPVIRYYPHALLDELEATAANRTSMYYAYTDQYLYKLLERFSLAGKSVVVMGSEVPFYESMARVFGAADITVIEYGRRQLELPARFTVLTPDEFEASPRTFDVAFSISSFEHDGLGRYGDPLSGVADLDVMARMKKIVKPGGHMLFVVPMGQDRVVWNLHRVYGRKRWPLLTQGWELVDSEGLNTTPPLFDVEPVYWYQPAVLLRNRPEKESGVGAHAVIPFPDPAIPPEVRIG